MTPNDGFIQNLGVFSEVLGIQSPAHVIYLSLVPWPDTQSRDTFIKYLTGKSVSGQAKE